MYDPSVKVERLGAAFIDMILFAIFNISSNTVLLFMMYGESFLDWLIDTSARPYDHDPRFVLFGGVITIVVAYFYYAVLPRLWRGQTLGKKLFGVRVIDKRDRNPKLIRHSLRAVVIWNHYVTAVLLALYWDDLLMYHYTKNLSDYATNLIVLISFVVILFRRDGRGLHDMITGTRVVARGYLPRDYKIY